MNATSAGVHNKHEKGLSKYEKGLSNFDTSKVHQICHKKGLNRIFLWQYLHMGHVLLTALMPNLFKDVLCFDLLY